MFRGGFAPQLLFDLSHINPDTVSFAVTLLRVAAIVQPLLGCEVHGLGTIVAQIVSRVVAILVRDDEFAFVVDHSIHCDAELGFEITGGDQVSFVTKKLITVFRITGPDTYRSSRH